MTERRARHLSAEYEYEAASMSGDKEWLAAADARLRRVNNFGDISFEQMLEHPWCQPPEPPAIYPQVVPSNTVDSRPPGKRTSADWTRAKEAIDE